METRLLMTSAVVISLSLSWAQARPAVALDVVQYHPSTSFHLNPNGGSETIDFGTLYIESDNTSGWTLEVQSQNEGNLSHSTARGSIPYSLRIDGSTVNNLSSGQSVAVRATSNLTCAPPNGCTYEVQGSVLSSNIDGKPAGSYSDQLTFTLISP